MERERKMRENMMTGGEGRKSLPTQTNRKFHNQAEIVRKGLLPPKATSQRNFPQDGRKLHQSLSFFHSPSDQAPFTPLAFEPSDTNSIKAKEARLL